MAFELLRDALTRIAIFRRVAKRLPSRGAASSKLDYSIHPLLGVVANEVHARQVCVFQVRQASAQ